MNKLIINIDGMSCSSCSASIERALKKTEGVFEVNVNYPAGKAFVTHDPDQISVAEIEQVVTNTGYEVLESINPESTLTNVNTIKLNISECPVRVALQL